MNKGVLVRACTIYVILSVLIFIGTAYYHYVTNATSDYICTSDTGSLMCTPADNLSYFNQSYEYIDMHLINRFVGNSPTIHVSKQYLVRKYPFSYGGLATSQSDLSRDSKAAHLEIARITKDLEYYESSYIEEAIGFAFKWAIVLPLSVMVVMFLGFGLKNYILHGTFKAGFK